MYWFSGSVKVTHLMIMIIWLCPPPPSLNLCWVVFFYCSSVRWLFSILHIMLCSFLQLMSTKLYFFFRACNVIISLTPPAYININKTRRIINMLVSSLQTSPCLWSSLIQNPYAFINTDLKTFNLYSWVIVIMIIMC